MLRKMDHCNVEALLEVRKAIEEEHDGIHLNMGSWAASAPGCGTTMCIAGWAVYLSDTHYMDFQNELAIPAGKALDDLKDARGNLTEAAADHCPGITAARLLGLSKRDADKLFYPRNVYDDKDQALRTIDHFIATGEVNWRVGL